MGWAEERRITTRIPCQKEPEIFFDWDCTKLFTVGFQPRKVLTLEMDKKSYKR